MTSTDLANLALAKIGANQITNIEEEPHIALPFRHSREQILRSHPWNFAEVFTQLAEVTPAAYPSGFDTAYNIPGDFLKLVRLDSEEAEVDAINYRIAGRTLFCNKAAPVLTYTTNNPPTSTWPPDFSEAFTSLLASKLASTLLQSTPITKAMRDEYLNDTLPEAKRSDGLDSSGSYSHSHQSAFATSPAILARRGFGRNVINLPRTTGVTAPTPTTDDLDAAFESEL